jgi:PAS domain S-box-containing protein
MGTNDNNYNIVIVDDEVIVTSNLKTLLKLEGFKTPEVFNSSGEALEFIKKSKVDMVISDFFMPEINGIELLKETRKVHPGATLVLLTGYADKESAIRAINEIGLYRYIEKPWDNEDLILCIKNGLERSGLIEKLQEKIWELQEAKKQLERYNSELEVIVRERTEDIRKLNYKLCAIINHCADGIVTVTKEGMIIQSNPAFRVICGLNESLNKNISDICRHDNGIPLTSKLDSEKDVLIRDYKVENIVLGRLIPVEISFAPIITDIEQGANFFVGVIRDVTLNQEMERLRDDFIATLTHDLRTPLLAAIQTLQFFLDGTLGSLSEKQTTLLETMMYSNQDMLGLVNALLEVYKYESGQLTLCKEKFLLKPLIEQCVKEICSLAESREMNISIEEIPEGRIFGDKQELKRVIANFLGNAVKHTQRGGSVKINAVFAEDGVTICVEDTGGGIPEEDIPKLFNRFSQGTGKKRSTSTGLGLYLSRQIIEAHGGRIWLESELNMGSRFKFTVPMEKSYERV